MPKTRRTPFSRRELGNRNNDDGDQVEACALEQVFGVKLISKQPLSVFWMEFKAETWRDITFASTLFLLQVHGDTVHRTSLNTLH